MYDPVAATGFLAGTAAAGRTGSARADRGGAVVAVGLDAPTAARVVMAAWLECCGLHGVGP
jgi:hypothetical protein